MTQIVHAYYIKNKRSSSRDLKTSKLSRPQKKVPLGKKGLLVTSKASSKMTICIPKALRHKRIKVPLFLLWYSIPMLNLGDLFLLH